MAPWKRKEQSYVRHFLAYDSLRTIQDQVCSVYNEHDLRDKCEIVDKFDEKREKMRNSCRPLKERKL
jgi:hypothetical protein